MTPDYSIGPEDFEYDDLEPWSFYVDDVEITWSPKAPHIVGDGSPGSEKVVDQLYTFISRMVRVYGETMSPDITGVYIPTSPTSPYMVRYAAGFIYGDTSDLAFSKNAPTFQQDVIKNSDEDPEIN